MLLFYNTTFCLNSKTKRILEYPPTADPPLAEMQGFFDTVTI